jgi:hypothetical protein
MCRNRSILVPAVALLVFLPALPITVAQSAAGRAVHVTIPQLDLDVLRAEDAQRDLDGLPPRFAVPHETFIRPDGAGTWDDRDPQVGRWSLRIAAPGALSLNLGFTAYYMPPGGTLRLVPADGSPAVGPFTAADNAAHGELWTPVVLADDITVDVRVPREAADQLILELTSINVGYRYFGEPATDRSGACNVDVVCPEGDDWRNEIPAVGVISTGGYLFCTGFMVNNTAQDGTPYFMTANHCGVNSGNAASLVVYWNYQSPTCGQHGGGQLNQFQTGSYFRASHSASDFTLVELDELPNPAWEITYAGWDRSTADPTSAVGIHHPNTDEKSISFEFQPCQTTSYLGTTVPGDGTHIRVIDWDIGTTEPGSSGSPLFDQNHRVVGQLHGGYAACGNDLSDWYGRFSRSWTGGGSNSTRLSNWLDPLNTGAMTLDTLAPGRLEVSPATGLSGTGEPGGPFAPDNIVYTLSNASTTPIEFEVHGGADWISISNATGTIPGQSSVVVTVELNAYADLLPPGRYHDTVTFVNTTNHSGDTTRPVDLEVGHPEPLYTFPLDSDPGWSTQGEWAFGQPTGQGGAQYGFPDPTAGATDAFVYGVNLNGDYATTYGGPYYLTLGPIDLSHAAEATLRFRRWLNSDYEPYVQAMIEVSSDGTAWHVVWSNGGQVIKENVWSSCEHDISAVADHAPAVYIRWGYRIRNGAYAYSGWNIDDVEVWAFSQGPGTDCNGNGIPDATDIASGTSGDDNENGVPDECEQLAGDLNCDAQVDFADINPFVLLMSDEAGYLAAYPNCTRINGDVNDDGQVDFGDINPFVALLSGS